MSKGGLYNQEKFIKRVCIMRILFCHNFFSSFGGAEESVIKEFNELQKRGHEVFFFATDKKPYRDTNYPYLKYFPKYIDHKSLQTIDAIKNCFSSFYNFEAKEKIEKYIDEIKPDVVKLHNICYYLTPSIIDACYEKQIPMVMTLHDPMIACPCRKLLISNKDYCKEELCVNKNPLPCILNRCKHGKLTASIIVALEHLVNKYLKIYDKISYFVCPSEAIRELTIRAGINESKLITINHFLEDARFTQQSNYNNNGYFLYVGRLSKEKGVEYLIKAMSLLSKEIRLHIVGEGQEKENLHKLVTQLGLTNIEFLGYKNGEELEKEYANCISTVQPCNWFETFGRTVIESYLQGKPVIASNIGALPELIDNGKTGYIVEPTNIGELACAIEKLYSNNNLVLEMGKKARRLVEEKFNSDIYYSKMSHVLNLTIPNRLQKINLHN